MTYEPTEPLQASPAPELQDVIYHVWICELYVIHHPVLLQGKSDS